MIFSTPRIRPQPNWRFNSDANTGHGQCWCTARFALRRRLTWALGPFKMIAIRTFILSTAAVFCGQVAGQSLGYQDATSILGAAGMMKMTIQGNDYMRQRCISKFPELQRDLEANLAKWQVAEADGIRKAEAIWPSMVEQDPRFSAMLSAMDEYMNSIVESFERMPPDVGQKMYMHACSKHFADLASGIWRQRTPNAYRYLDEAK